MASSGNFCTINPVGAQGRGTVQTGTISNANTAVAIDEVCFGTVGVTSGKWYWEWALTGSSDSGMAVGWANQEVNSSVELGYNSPASGTNAQIVYMYVSPSSGAWDIISDAPKGASSGTDSDKTGTVVQNDIISLAADFDNDKWYFGINGSYTAIRSGQNPSTGSNPMCSASGGGGLVTISRTANLIWYPAFGNWAASTRNVKVNFGQDSTFSASFSAGGNSDENGFGDFKYAVPTGFKAMCSANLPISADIDPAQTDTDFPQKQFNTVLYTGNSTNGHAITGLGFQPDMVWFQRRNQSGSYGIGIIDSNRGANKGIYPNRINGEADFTNDFVSFDTDGFTLNAGSSANINNNGQTFVAWCWKANGGTTSSNSNGSITATVQANTKAGFSIATYTSPGSGTNKTVGHGLSGVDFVITKNISQSFNWYCFHKSAQDKTFRLNDGGEFTYSNWSMGATTWGSEDGYTHNSTDNYVAYCWQNVDGMQRFGSFTGSGNSDGQYIHLGFRPRLLVLKRQSSSGFWNVFDSARKTFNSSSNAYLTWNTTDSEANGVPIDFLGQGFKVRSSGSGVNSSGNTILYMAWADQSAKYSNAF